MTPLGRTSSKRIGGHALSAEINVTPLVDVMLVLLVVFMVTSPLLAAGLKLDLPKAATATPLDPREPIVICVDRDGHLALGDDPLAPEALVDAVRARLDGAERDVRIRGDRGVAYGAIVEVVDRLASAGIRRVALVAQTGARADGPAAERPAAGGAARPAGSVPALP